MISVKHLWKLHRERAGKVSGEVSDRSIVMKHGDVDGSRFQASQLEHVMKCLKERFSEEKVNKLGSLCVGEYDREHNTVVVKSVKGRVWSHYGYIEAGVMRLHPEEALFLMDVGTLRVYLEDVPLSLQEAMLYFLSRQTSLTIHHCMMYAHLSRLGYIVRRKEAASLVDQPSKRKQLQRDEELAPKSVKACREASGGFNKMKISTADSDEMSQERTDKLVNVSTHMDEQSHELVHTQPLKYTKFDYSSTRIEEMSQLSLPEGSSNEQTSARGQHSVLDQRYSKLVSDADNWMDFKRDHRRRLQEQTRHTHTPLVDLTSYRGDLSDVLDRLTLSRTLDSQSYHRKEQADANLVHNVYQPSPAFRKTDSKSPHHRVVVVTPDAPLPSLSDILCCEVPVYHAVCDDGDISYYAYTQTCIPRDVYKERPRKYKKSQPTGQSEIEKILPRT